MVSGEGENTVEPKEQSNERSDPQEGHSPSTPTLLPLTTHPRSYALPLSGPVIGLIAVLGLFIVLFGLRGELHRFISLRNLQVLVHGDTITAVAALGTLMIIISGGIDLSTGSV